MSTRTIKLPAIKVVDDDHPRALRRPVAYYVCRAVGLSQRDIADEAGTAQGVVAAVMTGRNRAKGSNVRPATVKLLARRGYRYTDEQLFDR